MLQGKSFSYNNPRKSLTILNHFLLSSIWDILVGWDPKAPMVYNEDIIIFLLQNLKVCNIDNNEVFKKDIKIVNEFIQKTQIN